MLLWEDIYMFLHLYDTEPQKVSSFKLHDYQWQLKCAESKSGFSFRHIMLSFLGQIIWQTFKEWMLRNGITEHSFYITVVPPRLLCHTWEMCLAFLHTCLVVEKSYCISQYFQISLPSLWRSAQTHWFLPKTLRILL